MENGCDVFPTGDRLGAVARARFATVEEYLAAQPDEVRAVLEKVRAAIRKALPEAEECISYAIPAYRVNGRVAVYFAGFQEHYSVFPASDAMVAELGAEVAARRVSRGTLRFGLKERVPVRLIQKIAKFRAAEEGARRRAKTR